MVADVYDECTLNDVFIEGVDVFIRHILRNYWSTNARADLADITFQAKSTIHTERIYERRNDQFPVNKFGKALP